MGKKEALAATPDAAESHMRICHEFKQAEERPHGCQHGTADCDAEHEGDDHADYGLGDVVHCAQKVRKIAWCLV